MPSTVLVGAQWGDEGKGKICDQVPSGIMYSDHVSVIGNGCIVNPKVVLEEIDMFEADGITTKNLKISGNAHVIMPYHIDLDGAFEQKLGKKNSAASVRATRTRWPVLACVCRTCWMRRCSAISWRPLLPA